MKKIIVITGVLISSSLLLGCGEQDKKVTIDMLAGQWTCNLTDLKTAVFDDGKFEYKDDDTKAKDKSIKMIFEIKDNGIYSKNISGMEKEDVIVEGMFRDKSYSKTMLKNHVTTYTEEYAYVSNDEFNYSNNNEMIRKDPDSAYGTGFKMMMNCHRIKQ